VLVQDGNMARRKFLSDEEQLEILFNDDCGDELIPELDLSDSDSDCGNESSDTLVHDGAEVSGSELVPDTSPNYCPTLPNFSSNVGINVNIENPEDIMSDVNLFVTDSFLNTFVNKLIYMQSK
jgi:hypothetical protein